MYVFKNIKTRRSIMKKKTLLFTLLFLIYLLLSLISCSDELPDNSFITLSQNVVTFTEIGERIPITAQIFAEEADAEPEWTTSNPEVAIYENGEICAVGYGTCVIRASYKNVSAACTVYLEDPYSSIKLSAALFNFGAVGEQSTVSAFSGENNLTPLVKWTTSNPAVATCNQNGVITTVGYGACIITAKLDSKTATAAVIVENPDQKTLTLSRTELSLNPGESYTLTAEANNHTPLKISWICSDPELLECTDGVLTAKSRGVCAVVAVTDAGASAVCKVTIDEPPAEPVIDPSQLIFTMPKLPQAVHTVDSESGEIVASATVLSYTVTPELDFLTGKLYLHIEYQCVKSFDKHGTDAETPIYIATNLYRENDEHCERKLYAIKRLKVGEAFTVECSLFSVQTSPNVCRTLYMTLENICEFKDEK